MVKNKHIYILLGELLLVGIIYFVYQFSFSNSDILIDLHKSKFQPYKLPIAKFYKIPDTSYLYTKCTDHYDMETIRGHLTMGDQHISLIDLKVNSRIIDRYFRKTSKNAFLMNQDFVFLINGEPMVQCHFISLKSTILKSIYDSSPFFIKRYFNAPNYRPNYPIILSLTKNDTNQINQDDVHLQSIFALDGQHPFIMQTQSSSIDSYQLLEWKRNRWVSYKSFNAPYTFQAFSDRVHGYTKNAWIVQKQGSLLIHSRADLDKTTEISMKHIGKILSIGPDQRLGSLIFLNEGWNFGASNLLFHREPNMKKGQQAAYKVLEVQVDNDNTSSIVLATIVQNNLVPFSSLMNDEVLLVSPDVDLSFNSFILSGKSSLYALQRKPDGEFNSEPIEVDVPDDAFVSKFPIGDDNLLIYRKGTFFKIKWDTGEMTELYSMN